jgi:hypothetical protein
MTTAENLSAFLRACTDELVITTYVDTARMRLGYVRPIAPLAVLGILMRETEHELRRRGIDVDALCDALYGPDEPDQDLEDEKHQERRWHAA